MLNAVYSRIEKPDGVYVDAQWLYCASVLL